MNPEINTQIVEQMTKSWMAAIEGMSRVQEQNEKILTTMIEQNREAREQTRRVAEKMIEQMCENQKSMFSLMETATKTMAGAFQVKTGAN